MLQLILIKEDDNTGEQKVLAEWNSHRNIEVFKHLNFGQGTCCTVMSDPDASAEIDQVCEFADVYEEMLNS
jgi:hypothetical protein